MRATIDYNEAYNRIYKALISVWHPYDNYDSLIYHSLKKSQYEGILIYYEPGGRFEVETQPWPSLSEEGLFATDNFGGMLAGNLGLQGARRVSVQVPTRLCPYNLRASEHKRRHHGRVPAFTYGQSRDAPNVRRGPSGTSPTLFKTSVRSSALGIDDARSSPLYLP